jgi:predicted ester cyclase
MVIDSRTGVVSSLRFDCSHSNDRQDIEMNIKNIKRTQPQIKVQDSVKIVMDNRKVDNMGMKNCVDSKGKKRDVEVSVVAV